MSGAGPAHPPTPPVRIRHFTDPTCPFAFSAEPSRLRLLWLYGSQIAWQLHLVVLREEAPPEEDWPVEAFLKGRRKLFEDAGMPFDWTTPIPPSGSWQGCLAVAAARRHADDLACSRILRALRLESMANRSIDDPAVLDAAIATAGLEPSVVRGWMADPESAADLRRDMEEARSPSPAALAQDYKLGGSPEQRRYTCPSYEFFRLTPPPADWEIAERFDVPGYRPTAAYETTLANLAPELRRRPDPESVTDVLEWADWPLATAEVAGVCDRDIDDVRLDLAAAGASFTPAGSDGYWS